MLVRGPARGLGGPVWTPAEPALKFSHHRSGDAALADVAQLVAHHLAKVRVAGSNPVVRSENLGSTPDLQDLEYGGPGVSRRNGRVA